MTQTKDAENAALNRPQKDISLKYEKLETSKYLCSTSAGKVDFRQLIFFPPIAMKVLRVWVWRLYIILASRQICKYTIYR